MELESKNLIQKFVQERGLHLGFLRVLCRDSDWAEELFQQLSVTVIERAASFDPGKGDFGQWVRGLARNLYREALRNRKKSARLEVVLDSRLEDALLKTYDARPSAEEASYQERLSALRFCLQKLPEDQRRILQERYEKRYSSRRMAAVNHKTVSTVDTALCRIRAALLTCIKSRMGVRV